MRVRRGGDVGGDSGVIAVITAIVVVLALLPLSALALTTYTRAGVHAEMVRSADSGSLAGAAALSLIDLSQLPADLPDPIPSEYLPGATRVLGPDGSACRAARRAMEDDDALSDAFAGPGAGLPCNAVYAPSPPFGPCVDSIGAALPALPVPPAPVPGLPDPTLVTTAVRNLLPAFLENGVRVTVTYRVQGPLDALIPGSAEAEDRTAVSTARRRFKRLLPPLGTELTPTQQSVVTAIQTLIGQLGPIVGEDPDPDLPTPLPDPGPVTLLSGACKAAAQELLADLSDALNVDPNGAQRIACLTQVVLGIPEVLPPVVIPPVTIPPTLPTVPSIPSVPSGPPPLPECTDDVFRAQLAPNPAT